MPPKLANSVKKVNLIAPEDWLEMVDNWRKHQPGLPNRSVAIRKLVLMGLEAGERRDKKPKPKP